jgi:hypothetical protein
MYKLRPTHPSTLISLSQILRVAVLALTAIDAQLAASVTTAEYVAASCFVHELLLL